MAQGPDAEDLTDGEPSDAALALTVSFSPAPITADFKTYKRQLAAQLAPLEGITPEDVERMGKRDAKKLRAGLGRASRLLMDRYREVKRAYEQPIKDFKAHVDELDAMIQEKREVIDSTVKLIEAGEREARLSHLRQYYEEYAPEFSKVVDFDLIKDERWKNATFGVGNAEAALRERVDKLAYDRDRLEAERDELHFPEEAEREFFRTLDYDAAIAFDRRQWQQQQRVDELHERIDGIMPPQKPSTTEPQFRAYTIRVALTNAQRDELIAWFKERDIHGTFQRQRND